jgi:hypothetical protein
MKNLTFFLIVIALSIAMLSCSNSDNKTEKNSKDDSEQAVKTEKQDLLTQQGFEKMLAGYGITLYADAKFEKINKNSSDDIVATYNVNNLSEESKQKVKDYISSELSKLKNSGWKVEESFGMAMKKEGNYTTAIQIGQNYAPDLEIHSITYSFGKVY